MPAPSPLPFHPACGALAREVRRLGGRDTAPAYRPDRACAAGCNCVERLLGAEAYRRECAAGALFLLEDWAPRWREWARAAFGDDGDVLREIIGADHRYLLCLRTPCSGDFAAEAAAIGRRCGLPVRWLTVGLDELGAALAPAGARGRAS